MRIPDLIKLSCSQCFTGNAFHLGRIVPWLAAEPPQGTAATLSPGAGDIRVAGGVGTDCCSWRCCCAFRWAGTWAEPEGQPPNPLHHR